MSTGRSTKSFIGKGWTLTSKCILYLTVMLHRFAILVKKLWLSTLW